MNVSPTVAARIPTVNVPVRMPELRETRARFLAGVITGGVLIVLDAAGLVVGMVLL